MLLLNSLWNHISAKMINFVLDLDENIIVAVDVLILWLQLKRARYQSLVAMQSKRERISTGKDHACQNACSTAQSCRCFLDCSDAGEFLHTF